MEPTPGAASTSGSLRSIRVAVVASALAAPIVHALLLAPLQPALPWLTAAALAGGIAAGRGVPAAAVAAVLAVGPVWQVALALATGSTDLHLVMPWLAALVACLAGRDAVRWHAPPPWLVPIAAWALVLAATWPVVVARELDFTLRSLDALDVGGSASGPARLVTASAVLFTEAQLAALLLFDRVAGASTADRARTWRWLAPGVAVACAAAVAQGLGSPAWLSREPWIELERAAGTLYDANAAGALAALFAPLLAVGAALGHARGAPPWHTAAWLAAAFAAVLATASRTALAAWLIAAAAWGWSVWRSRQTGGAAPIAAVVVLVAAAAGAGLAGAARVPALARAVDTIRGAAAGVEIAVHSLLQRDGYAPTADRIIAEHPAVGVGTGMFAAVVPDYARITVERPLPPDNAQNWWRQQWAELGLLGALGAVACSLLAAAAAWRGLGRGRVPWAAALAALGSMSLVSPPVQHPVLYPLVGLLVATAVAEIDGSGERRDRPPRRLWTPLVWLGAAACVAGLVVEGRGGLRPPQRAARFGYDYNYGLSGEVDTPLGRGHWSATRGVGVFQVEGTAFVVDVRLPHDDLAAAPVRVAVSDQDGERCAEVRRDASPLTCRLAVPAGGWLMLQIDVARAWPGDPTGQRAAVATVRGEP